MAKGKNNRLRIAMDFSNANDKWRQDTIAGIVQLAPTSPLMAIAAIQASVTTLGTLGASLKAANDTVAAARTKLASEIETEANIRRAVDGELLMLKAAVETKSTQASDLASLGFAERGGPPARAQLVPPEAVDVRLPSGKVRGQVTASAREVGKVKWRYAAAWSLDPAGDGSWVTLPGYGKARKVTGASGSRVWVRFARVRGQEQSEWGTPVLVTIP